MDLEMLRQGAPITPPPFITADLPGIGGEIKLTPAHFVVEELPLYQPEGSGQHLYLRLSREGWTTPAVARELARLFGVDQAQVGLAGLKDKQARVTQTFSLPREDLSESQAAQRLQDTPFTLHWARHHRNKLKRGHLLGNRFSIVISSPAPQALALAGEIASALSLTGLPNYYGAQRFGGQGDNAARGRALITGRRRPRGWLENLLMSSYQALLFNAWLELRLERGWFDRLLAGDMAKKLDTGGMFVVEDPETETARSRAGQISPTGPIFGARGRLASGEPGALEQEVLEASGVKPQHFKRAGLQGSRRTARLVLPPIQIQEHEQGLSLGFSLPKGAYATVLLREFCKSEPQLPDE